MAGSTVMAVRPGYERQVLSALAEKQIKATVIGEFTENAQGAQLITNGLAEPMLYYEKDPYWTAFFGALKKGWK